MRSRTGFTVTEVVVSLAIISLLFSILLPAVQMSRSKSRSVQCRNNLHQQGIAIHNHEATDHYLRGTLGLDDLLEYPVPTTPEEAGNAAYPLLVCPDDFVAVNNRGHIPSYLFNIGNERQQGRKRNGIVGYTRAADVTDGLSQTALVSERLLLDIPFGPGVQDDPRRFSGFTPTPRPHPEGLDAFAELCRTQRTMPVIWQGTNPFVFGTLPYDYTHVLGPNSNSCINGTPTPPTMEVDDSMRIDTPTSLHPGGVHLLLCDGAVRFISDEIDLNVWQAMGSRNGHESVGEF